MKKKNIWIIKKKKPASQRDVKGRGITPEMATESGTGGEPPLLEGVILASVD